MSSTSPRATHAQGEAGRQIIPLTPTPTNRAVSPVRRVGSTSSVSFAPRQILMQFAWAQVGPQLYVLYAYVRSRCATAHAMKPTRSGSGTTAQVSSYRRADAKPVGASAAASRATPIHGRRPARGQPHMHGSDQQRCHASMHAWIIDVCFLSSLSLQAQVAYRPATYQGATASGANQHDAGSSALCFSAHLCNDELRAAHSIVHGFRSHVSGPPRRGARAHPATRGWPGWL